MDRAEQERWLRGFAAFLANDLDDANGDAEGLVEYALGDGGRDWWNIEPPEWLDDYRDRALLAQWIIEEWNRRETQRETQG